MSKFKFKVGDKVVIDLSGADNEVERYLNGRATSDDYGDRLRRFQGKIVTINETDRGPFAYKSKEIFEDRWLPECILKPANLKRIKLKDLGL